MLLNPPSPAPRQGLTAVPAPYEGSLLNYLMAYPGRLRDQFTQGMQQFAATRNPVAALGALNPTTPFIQDAALQAGGLIAPQANQLNQAVSQGSENLGLGPLSIPEVTDEQLAPFLMLGMGSPSKMGFFSPSGKALTTAPGKGTSQQYLAHLKKEPGATKEAKQTGLIQKLEEAPGTLTKEEVVSMWNPIELTETVKGQNPQASENYVPENRSRWVSERWQSEIDQAERAGDFSRAEELTLDWEYSEGLGHGSTKYGNEANLNLPGGEEPKEILVQLDDPASQKRIEQIGSELETIFRSPEYRQSYLLPEHEADILRDRVHALKKERDDLQYGGRYKSSHWDEPNVLAHIRTNKRDVGGVSALHAEEFQSDWHQEGQKKGYSKPPLSVDEIELESVPRDQAIRESGNSEFISEQMDKWRTNQGYPLDALVTRYRLKGDKEWSLHFKPGYTREEVFDHAVQKYKMGQLHNDPSFEERIRASNQGVPDAPYKKDWHELAFKRFLMEGINDPSVDRITWTSGDVQADRYNLAKYINEIEAKKHESGLFSIAVKYKEGNVEHLTNVPSDQLDDFVGKEMAEKIVADKGGTYSGLDLQVGGEFHKNLYDKKIPQFAKKFLKKYGVEPKKWQADAPEGNEFAVAEDGTVYYVGGTDAEGNWFIYKEMPDDAQGNWVDDVPTEKFGSEEAASKALREYGNLNNSPYDLWYIDITPEMRQDLQQKGVPLAMNDRRPQAGLLA